MSEVQEHYHRGDPRTHRTKTGLPPSRRSTFQTGTAASLPVHCKAFWGRDIDDPYANTGKLTQVGESTLIAEGDCAEHLMALTDSIAANSTVVETSDASNSAVAKSGGLAVTAWSKFHYPHSAN